MKSKSFGPNERAKASRLTTTFVRAAFVGIFLLAEGVCEAQVENPGVVIPPLGQSCTETNTCTAPKDFFNQAITQTVGATLDSGQTLLSAFNLGPYSAILTDGNLTYVPALVGGSGAVREFPYHKHEGDCGG
jgi:hypothetical protein